MRITDLSELGDFPSAEDVREAVTAAYAAVGYIKEDGRRDSTKLRRDLAGIFTDSDRLVETKGQRKTRALTRAQLVEAIFHLPDPSLQDAPSILSQLVYEKLTVILWGETSTGGKLQDVVHDVMDNGHFVARYLVTGEAPKAYASDRWDCLSADYAGRIELSLLNKVETTTRRLEDMAAHRPADARRIVAASRKLLASMQASHARIELAAGEAEKAAAEDTADDAGTGADES